uniref:cytochrome b n=1 Tax=Pachycondyla annamita TaxID=613577 RepID=UPI00255203EA|nr:cytochrome b [Pachycondyla annamita]WGF22864.1 cytochrome b [Pachycondyla annamita]
MIKQVKSFLNLPMPVNISYMWNFGSLLGLFLFVQIMSGFFLSMHYCPNINFAFFSIIHIMQNVKMGWLMHNIHMNGASLFFIFMYMHISRGMFYQSYNMLSYTWMTGISILLISMATAFLGYVLPWGQMSFWGATVITNLISTIPYIGINVVQWIWGGFSINNSTLNRFFSLHFILPFIIMMMIILHLYFLHEKGSSNPLGTNSNLYKIPFNMYFIIKDLLGFNLIILFFMIMILEYPYNLSDPDNFIPANPMVTPIHIQPEWYFLFAYAILRSIPNKLGGVIALLMSILIFYILIIINFIKMSSLNFYFPNQILYWFFLNNCIILTWLGSQPIEYPYMSLSQLFSFFYFLYFFINVTLMIFWEKIIFMNNM